MNSRSDIAGGFFAERRRLLHWVLGAGAVAATPTSWFYTSAFAAAGNVRRADPGWSYSFLQPAEIAFLNAAVGRLIPEDDLGPGAVRAGVTVFIDRQLSGPFGNAADWYMTGPWSPGTGQQGYQLERTPAQLYRAAIAALDTYCRQGFSQKVFAALAPAEQDDLLHGLESDKLSLPGVPAKAFFDMLWQNTKEGFFADPMYEGNRDFIGWKLIGFPDPRYNYTSEVRHFGQRYPLPPVGLLGSDPWRRAQVPA